MEFNIIINRLLGLTIGDAYGAGYEFRYETLEEYKKNLDFTKYDKHPNPRFQKAKGMYTDDTQMSLAIIEVLIEQKEFTKEILADKFVEVYKRDPIKTYAKGFRKFLENIDSGKEFLEKIRPDSIRNGAAMRSVPLGIIKDKDKLVEYARINASVTHDTPQGRASSIAVALMSNLELYEKLNKNTILENIHYIENEDSETSNQIKQVLNMKKFDHILMFGEKYKNKGIPCDAIKTIGAITYILTNFNNPQDVLKESIYLGGDTDSVASISLGINMINHSINELPEFLFKDLINHKFGKEYIIGLGNQIQKIYGIKESY